MLSRYSAALIVFLHALENEPEVCLIAGFIYDEAVFSVGIATPRVLREIYARSCALNGEFNLHSSSNLPELVHRVSIGSWGRQESTLRTNETLVEAEPCYGIAVDTSLRFREPRTQSAYGYVQLDCCTAR